MIKCDFFHDPDLELARKRDPRFCGRATYLYYRWNQYKQILCARCSWHRFGNAVKYLTEEEYIIADVMDS